MIYVMSLDNTIESYLASAQDLNELSVELVFSTPWNKDQFVERIETLGEAKDFPVKSIVISYEKLFQIIGTDNAILQSCLRNHNVSDFLTIVSKKGVHFDVGGARQIPSVLLAPLVRYMVSSAVASELGIERITEGTEIVE